MIQNPSFNVVITVNRQRPLVIPNSRTYEDKSHVSMPKRHLHHLQTKPGNSSGRVYDSSQAKPRKMWLKVDPEARLNSSKTAYLYGLFSRLLEIGSSSLDVNCSIRSRTQMNIQATVGLSSLTIMIPNCSYRLYA